MLVVEARLRRSLVQMPSAVGCWGLESSRVLAVLPWCCRPRWTGIGLLGGRLSQMFWLVAKALRKFTVMEYSLVDWRRETCNANCGLKGKVDFYGYMVTSTIINILSTYEQRHNILEASGIRISRIGLEMRAVEGSSLIFWWQGEAHSLRMRSHQSY